MHRTSGRNRSGPRRSQVRRKDVNAPRAARPLQGRRQQGERKQEPLRGAKRDVASGSLADTSLVIGKRAACEVLRHAPERIREILIVTGGAGEGDASLPRLLQEFKGAPVREVSEQELTGRAGSASHQGIALVVSPRRELTLREAEAMWRETPEALVLAVDGVEDPHNLGAILRAAECFGCSAVMLGGHRLCPITPTVTKTSVGASELVPIIRVANLSQGIERLAKVGFWSIVSALREDARSLYETAMPRKAVIVVGGEGRGVQPLVVKRGDLVVQVPMRGDLQSLNVAQATAVLLSHYWASPEI